jgi:hypothetical protein
MATLDFDAPITTGQVGDLYCAPGVAELEFALLNNVGATFDPGDGVLVSGTIDGGTLEGVIDISGNLVTPGYGASNALTLSGGVAFDDATLDISNAFDPTYATGGILSILGEEILANVNINLERSPINLRHIRRP